MMHRFYIIAAIIFCISIISKQHSFNTHLFIALNKEDTLQPKILKDTISFVPMSKIYPPPSFGLKKVGYILDFRSPKSIPDIRFKQCNVIVFAFAYINSKGIYFLHANNLESFSDKAHKAGCKILLGISGSNQMFSYITATEERRIMIIQNIMKAVRKYHLQGVDIDWEFPSVKNKTDDTFTLFLKQLSDSCHINGKYYLSCAIAPGVSGGRRSAAIDNDLLTGTWVDWFNIMVYDNFSETTPYIHHSNFDLSVRSFKYWLLNRKIQPEKCVMGLPLYGRPSGIKQFGHVKTYAAIMQNGGDPFRDSCMYHADTTKIKDSLAQYTLYYDGLITIQRKSLGAAEYGGGIMFWEIGQDINSKYSLIKAATAVIDAEQKNRSKLHKHP